MGLLGGNPLLGLAGQLVGGFLIRHKLLCQSEGNKKTVC